jgi:hypothetical protein
MRKNKFAYFTLLIVLALIVVELIELSIICGPDLMTSKSFTMDNTPESQELGKFEMPLIYKFTPLLILIEFILFIASLLSCLKTISTNKKLSLGDTKLAIASIIVASISLVLLSYLESIIVCPA